MKKMLIWALAAATLAGAAGAASAQYIYIQPGPGYGPPPGPGYGPPPGPGYYGPPPGPGYGPPPPGYGPPGRYYGEGGYYRPGRFRTWNGCQPGWTVQDGLCKPYRGY